MEDFFDGLERSIKDVNMYGTIVLALAIPDICGKAAYNLTGNGKRYRRWANEYFIPKYVTFNPSHPSGYASFMTAGDLWQLRCSALHQGSDQLDTDVKNTLSKFIFIEPNEMLHNSLTGPDNDNLKLILCVRDFGQDMLDAAREWWSSVSEPDKERINGTMIKIRSLEGFCE